MIVKYLEISKLYGYLDKKIDFNEDISLLVGINGAGKTSILNVVNWMLAPSLPHLATVEFSTITINFFFKEELYQAKATQSDKSLSYNLSNITTGTEYYPLHVTLKIAPKSITQNESLKYRYLIEYRNLNPTVEEIDTYTKIFNEIPKPIAIGLDRAISDAENSDLSINDDISRRAFVEEKDTPLDKVREIANREFTIYKSKIVDLNQNLNNKILLSAFESVSVESINEINQISDISIEQVETLNNKVSTFLKETVFLKKNSSRKNKHSSDKKDQQLEQIQAYFDNLKNLIDKTKKLKEKEGLSLEYILNINQFKKIRQFLKEFEQFERSSKNFFSPIQLYLDTVNNFLKNSSKELVFDTLLSELKFNILDREGNIISSNRDIRTLSSGERQILTLLTYIKFFGKGGVFIIDEPELSLHPKWQEEFLEAVEVLMPKNTQLILATHSPVIVGSRKKYAKVLLPFN